MQVNLLQGFLNEKWFKNGVFQNINSGSVNWGENLEVTIVWK